MDLFPDNSPQRNEGPCLDNEIEANSTKKASFQAIGEKYELVRD